MITISDIEKSYERISGFIVNTPIITSNRLNELFIANLFLKDETNQHTGSYKIRGSQKTGFSKHEGLKIRGSQNRMVSK